MKKFVIAALIASVAAAGTYAQQITRFAVVDLTRVYAAFLPESGAARQLELDSAAVQAEINRMSSEIQAMQSARMDALARGDSMSALRLEEQIRNGMDFLREFHAVRTAELESRRRALAQSDEFLGQMYSEIRLVAEREGFTMVLDRSSTPGILWFSPTVDITDTLIQSILARRN